MIALKFTTNLKVNYTKQLIDFFITNYFHSTINNNYFKNYIIAKLILFLEIALQYAILRFAFIYECPSTWFLPCYIGSSFFPFFLLPNIMIFQKSIITTNSYKRQCPFMIFNIRYSWVLWKINKFNFHNNNVII